MREKFFNTLAMVLIICCFIIFLSGCNANKNDDNMDNKNVVLPTQTVPPNRETQSPDSITNTQTMPPDNEMQTPITMSSTQTTALEIETPTQGSASINQADWAEPQNTTRINTGLPDGTKVRLFVSGQEIHWAIIMGDDVLIPDYPYIFGQLKDAGGIELSGFWTISSADTTNIENALIYNSLYTIEIVEEEYSFTCNDKTLPLTVPAQEIDGRFYLPLIALAEAINAAAEWDADAQAIHFYYK